MDLIKIEAVMNWPRLTTVTEVRSFLHLAGYYRRFVERFSALATLLMRLLKKETRFEWIDKCEKELSRIKTEVDDRASVNDPVRSEKM